MIETYKCQDCDELNSLLRHGILQSSLTACNHLLQSYYMTAQEYKEKRESLGYTQQEAADNLGVFRETVARRETGKSAITSESWFSLCSLKAKKKKAKKSTK